jgi:hypothetical protein
MRVFGIFPLALIACTGAVSNDMAVGDLGADMTALPTNALLSGPWTLSGWLDDDNIVAHNSSDNTVAVMPVAGNSMTVLGTGDWVAVPPGQVFIYTDIDFAAGLTSIDVWTAAGGRKSLASSSTYFVALSADGQAALYFDSVDASNTVGTLVASKIDGTARMTVASNLRTGGLTGSPCLPQAAALGTAFVYSYCANVDADAGIASLNIDRFDFASGAHTTWLTDYALDGLSVDAAHSHLFVREGGSYNGTLYDAAGTPTSLGSVQTWAFREDGLFFYTTASSLVRYDPNTSTPTTLQTGSYPGLRLWGFSPDNATVMFSENSADWNKVDVYGASANGPGAITTYLTPASGTPGCFDMRVFFTADSAYALYSDQLDRNGVFTQLNAIPRAGGTAAPLAQLVVGIQPIGGSRLLVSQNYDRSTYTFDAAIIDAASPSVQTPIASRVNQALVSPSKTKVAWGVQGTSSDGVFARSLP